MKGSELITATQELDLSTITDFAMKMSAPLSKETKTQLEYYVLSRIK